MANEIFFRPMRLVDLVVRICFLRYLEWIHNSMWNSYFKTGFQHYLCTLLQLGPRLYLLLSLSFLFTPSKGCASQCFFE
jgi:hypothetical protein